MTMKNEKRPKRTPKGSSISDETFNYYKRVNESFKDLSGIDKDLFFTNVFRQLESEALVVCQHKILSTHIENLLKLALPKHILMLWKAFSPDWMAACTDAYASHVFHSLILCFPSTFDLDSNSLSVNQEDNDDKMETQDEKEESEDSDTISTRKMFLEFCSFLKEKIEELVTNTYASHIVRASIQVLTNIQVDNKITQSNKKADHPKVKIHEAKSDESFHKQFFKISKLITNSPHFKHYVCDKVACPVIQLLILHTFKLDPQKGFKLCNKIISLCGFFDVPAVDHNQPLTDSGRLPSLMMDVSASYLVQLLLEHCSEETFLSWYETSFKDRLIAYSVHEKSNYILQQVIDKCSNKQMFTPMFDEITPYLEDLLSMKHMGVIKSLMQKCLTLGAKQKKMVKKLLEAFHCEEEEKKIMIMPLIFAMKTYEVYMENIVTDDKVDSQEHPEKLARITVNIHGSLMAQTLLNFGNPIVFVESIFHLTCTQLISLMCDFFGKFIVKDFFRSRTIREKNKDLFLQKFKGFYCDIACDKSGSHSWQVIWPFLSVNQKTMISEELCQSLDRIQANKYARYVHSALALSTFHRNRSQWHSWQTTASKKNKLFDDILGPSKAVKKLKTNDSVELKENEAVALNTDQPEDAINFDLFKKDQ